MEFPDGTPENEIVSKIETRKAGATPAPMLPNDILGRVQQAYDLAKPAKPPGQVLFSPQPTPPPTGKVRFGPEPIGADFLATQEPPAVAHPPRNAFLTTNEPPSVAPRIQLQQAASQKKQSLLAEMRALVGAPQVSEGALMAEEIKRQVAEAFKANWNLQPGIVGGKTIIDSARESFQMPAPATKTAHEFFAREATPEQLAPFAGAAFDVKKSAELFAAAKRAEADQATPEDLALLIAHNSDKQRDSTLGYKVAKILWHLPAFAAELATTAGIYNLAKEGGEAAVLRGASKFIDQAAEKAAVKFAARATGGVAGSALQAAAAGPARIASGTIERMTPEVAVTDNGALVVSQTGETLPAALSKAYVEQFIETLTEHSGGVLGEVAGKIGRTLQLDKIPGAAKVQAFKAALQNFFRAKPGSTLDEALSTLRTKGAWNGWLSEIGEERIGEVLRPLLIEGEEYHFPSAEQLAAEGIAFAIPGAAAMGARAAERAISGRSSTQPPAAVPEAVTSPTPAPTSPSSAPTSPTVPGVPPIIPTPEPPSATPKAQDLADAAAQVNPAPTEAQKEAGNYKKGHVTIHGLNVSIENPAGSIRSGTDKSGRPWQVTMPAHYGYFKRTEGKDGDAVDTYIGPNAESTKAFVVNQVDAESGKFDEHKVMLGFDTQEQALAAYDAAFSDGNGPKRRKSVSETTVDGLKTWLTSGDTTKEFAVTQPAATPAVAQPRVKIGLRRGRIEPPVPDDPTPLIKEVVDAAARPRGVKQFFRDLGVAVERVVTLAREKAGLDIAGYNHIIDEDFVRHVFDKHGDPKTEISRGNIPVTRDDFGLIPQVISSPDSVEAGELNNGLPTLVLRKTFPDGTTIYVEEVRKGRRKLAAVTMYKKPPRALPSSASGEHTPEALPRQAQENIPQTAATSQAPEAQQGYGDKNKVFTRDKYEEAKRKLREKLKQVGAGVDPEIMMLAGEMGGYHVEAGVRKFSDWSAKMVEDVGENIRPYLKAIYAFIRNYPGFDGSGMESDAEVNAAPPAPSQASKMSPSQMLADRVRAKVAAGESFTWQQLFEWADGVFGGTQADGKYSPKDAYDAMELGVNQHIAEMPLGESPAANVAALKEIIQRLPTQTKRTAEQDEFQQFSTPPPFAYLAGWVAKLTPNDVLLEPSAGIGGLAVFGKKAGASVVVNELSPRRRAVLELMGFNRVFGENAEQLNNILPKDVVPTVVVMNPPFSSTAGRKQGSRDTSNGARHIEQALARLAPGGRLVAIVGEGMAMDRPVFRSWWSEIKSKYNVRANIGVNGQEYAKYGTTFDNQILVIDKTGPTVQDVIVGKVERTEDLIPLLQAIRDERNQTRTGTPANGSAEPAPAQPSGKAKIGLGRRKARLQPAPRVSTDGVGSSQPSSGSGQQRGTQSPAGETVPVDTAGSVELPDVRGTQSAGGRSGAGDRTGEESSGSSGNTAAAVGRDGGVLLPDLAVRENAASEEKLEENAVFEDYRPQINVEGAIDHPTPLAESAAMASVRYPSPAYRPKLPESFLKDGKISGPQAENVLLAGQAHSVLLPNGERRGYFIGDGTGVGKGRTIAAIILDNWNQGRKRAVWVSKNDRLAPDALRDLADVGIDPEFLLPHAKVKSGEPIAKSEAILFTNYKKLSSPPPKPKKGGGTLTRLEQIKKWLGPSFDGVIMFDEAHQMGNALESKGARGRKKPAAMALAAMDLQRAFPKARVVYVSATGATELNNLAYAERLGLWGEGTPFPNVKEFINQVGAGGVAALEVVAKDMKAMGLYLSRTLNFKGVEYDRVEQQLNTDQERMYNTLAEAWQVVLRNVGAAVEATGMTGQPRGKAMSAFWGAHQRFFNQILTSLQMPAVRSAIRRDVEDGHSVVVQIVNTNEAAMERAVSRKEEDEDTDLENLDITPREILMQYVENSFPTTQYEEFTDKDGNVRTRPVLDSEGNPVKNAEAVAMKEDLLNRLASISVPQGALDELIDTFGVDAVAEVTGRGRRVVYKETPEGRKRVIEPRGEKANSADVEAFRDDRKRILVFSDAGGTGSSYHADKRYKNQRLRKHYILQPGWRADNAIQGLGRSHRSNQAQPPFFRLVLTDIPGHKRFISTIARRLEQLGALTKGQRQTTSTGIFSARDNLESSYAREALRKFLRDVGAGAVEGLSPAQFEEQTGLALTDEDGNFVGEEIPIQQFLNRLLSMSIDMQRLTFEEFGKRLDAVIEWHTANGTLDIGLETLMGLSTRIGERKTLWTDSGSKAKTEYVKVEVEQPTKTTQWQDAWLDGVQFARNLRSGMIWKLAGPRSRAESSGRITEYYSASSPLQGAQQIDLPDAHDAKKFEILKGEAAKTLWNEVIQKAPKTRTDTYNLITGTILPIWDRLGGVQRIARAQTDKGERLLGILVPDSQLSKILSNFNVDSDLSVSPEQAVQKLEQGSALRLANGWRIKPVRVSGDERYELEGPSLPHHEELEKHGVFMERIQFKMRYFIPTSPATAAKTIGAITRTRPVVEVTGGQRFSLGAPTHGMSISRVWEAVDKLAAHWENAPQIDVVSRPEWAHEGALVRGVFDPGLQKVIINAAAIDSAEEAEFVVLHEVVGHYGLRQVLGSQFDTVLDEVGENISNQVLEPIAKERALNLSKAADRRLAIEEYIADNAGVRQSLWQQFVTTLRTLLRKLFGLTPTSNQIADLLNASRRAVEVGSGVDGVGSDAPRYSLKPISTTTDYKEFLGSADIMPKADADSNRKAAMAENLAAVGHLAEKFKSLPTEVRSQLGEISGRLAVVKRAAKDLGTGAPVGNLLNVVSALSPDDPALQTQMIFAAAVNMIALRDSQSEFEQAVEKLKAEVADVSQAEVKKSSEERLIETTAALINFERGRLTSERDKAAEDRRDALNAQLNQLVNADEGVRRVIEAAAGSLPASLEKTGTPEQIVDAFRAARAAGLTVYASDELIALTESMMLKTPDLRARLLSIRSPQKTERVIQLENLLDRKTKALGFLREALNAPEFRENLEIAAEYTGIREIKAKVNDAGELIYENPLNSAERVTIRNGFGSDVAQENANALLKAASWFQSYVDSPTADPIKRRAYEHQLWMIQNVHLNQAFNPEVGKLVAGDYNPFEALIRATAGWMDVLEHTHDMLAGRANRAAYQELQNYSNARQAVVQAHQDLRLKATLSAEKAAKAHGLTVPQWEEQIGDIVLGSYQNRGDVKLRAGSKVNGRTVTAQDMQAVAAQKAYTDGVSAAVRRLESSTATGKRSPIRIRDRVANTSIEREAQDISGMTVPQRLKYIARAFLADWEKASDRSLSKEDKQDAREEVLSRYFDIAVLSHFDSFSNPQYAADLKSPLRGYYRKLAEQRAESGVAPSSLDDAAGQIFDMQRDLPAEQQLSVEEIKEQIVKEIDHAVNMFTQDEKTAPKLVGDHADVEIVKAENFLNRPRGKRILPRGFYEYTVATHESQNSVQNAVLDIYAQRYLNSLNSLRDGLQTEITRMEEELKAEGGRQNIAKAQKLGANFLDYDEAKQLLVQVTRSIESFRTHVKARQTEETDLYTGFNLARGLVANSLLQRAGTLVANYFGSVIQRVQMEQLMLQSGRSIFGRIPFVRSVTAAAAAATESAKALVKTATVLASSPLLKNTRFQAAADELKRNPAVWSQWAASVISGLQEERQGLDRAIAAGVVDEDPAAHNLHASVALFGQGGRISRKPLTRRQRFFTRPLQSAITLFNELGMGIQLPRALGAHLVDRLINSQVDGLTRKITSHLHVWSAQGFKNRDAFGMDPLSTPLTPQEVFGRADATARDLTALRDFFGKAGVNLDKALIEYHQKLTKAKADGTAPEDVQLLSEDEYNSLMIEVGKWINKGMFSNRPFANNSMSRAMMLFMGYGINQNAQLSKLLAHHSSEEAGAKTTGRAALVTAELLFATILVGGFMAFPLAALLHWWLYRERTMVKDIAEAESFAEATKIAIQRSAKNLPLLGNALNMVMGTVAPTGNFGAFTMGLLPISMFNSVLSSASRAWQTGDFVRPTMDLVRQWFPNSRVLLNRTAMREGITDETALKASLAANAPTGVDVKGSRPQSGGSRIYSATSDNVDNIVNALSRRGGPDMAAVERERQKAIDQRVKDGQTPEQASASVDRAVLARNPYLAVYGRELTSSEMASLEAKMSPEEKAIKQRVEDGRRAYAQAFGAAEPDFVNQRREDGGSGPTRIGLRRGRLGPSFTSASAAPATPAPARVRLRRRRPGRVSLRRMRVRSRLPRPKRIRLRRIRSVS